MFRRGLHRILLGALLLIPRPASAQVGAAPSAGGAPDGAVLLYLELVVNGRPTGIIAPVRQSDGQFWIDAGDLRAASISLDATYTSMVPVARLTGVTAEYDSHAQRLHLRVPPGWLPSQVVRSAAGVERDEAASAVGVVLNYDVNVAAAGRQQTRLGIWTEGRLFHRRGTVSNTGLYQHASGPGARGAYVRHQTTWSLDDTGRAVTYAAGDVISGALEWTNAVRLGGVSIERNFRVRPDLVTYPVPVFAGEAAVPTTLDLLINGREVSRTELAPGPYTVENVPVVSGAGTATLTMTDALGRQLTRNVSFYVANNLLQKGLFDYSGSVGAVRRGYGLGSFGYGPLAASGVGRYGLSDRITISAHGQGGRDLAVAGGGAEAAVLRAGVVDLAVTTTRRAGVGGRQYMVGYGYTRPGFSVNLQRIARSEGYADVTSLDERGTGSRTHLARRIDQATAGVGLGSRGGSFGAGYFRLVAADGTRTRVVNFSYTRPLAFRSSLYVALSRNWTGAARERAVQVQVLVPIGSHGTFMSRARLAENGDLVPAVQYSRTASPAGGLEASAAYAGDERKTSDASVAWRTGPAYVQGGIRAADGQQMAWAGTSGAAILMGGGLFWANRVHDSFAVVSTGGVKGVPVRYENQLIGHTDRRGRLLVPSVTSYALARYEIDPLGLEGDLDADEVEKRVAVRQHSGALVKFAIRRMRAAVVLLTDAKGVPLPLGADVRHEESGRVAVSGWGGAVFLDELAAGANHLEVKREDGSRCSLSFSFPAESTGITRLGPLPCR